MTFFRRIWQNDKIFYPPPGPPSELRGDRSFYDIYNVHTVLVPESLRGRGAILRRGKIYPHRVGVFRWRVRGKWRSELFCEFFHKSQTMRREHWWRGAFHWSKIPQKNPKKCYELWQKNTYQEKRNSHKWQIDKIFECLKY